MITANFCALCLHRLLLLHLLESLYVLFELFSLLHSIFLLLIVRVAARAEANLIALVLACHASEL